MSLKAYEMWLFLFYKITLYKLFSLFFVCFSLEIYIKAF